MSVDMFPVRLPIAEWVSVDGSDPLRRQSAGVLASGRDFVIDRGQPYWKLTAKTRDLFPWEVNSLKAFKSKLRGSARFCLIYDPAVEYPAAYMPKGPPPMVRAGLALGFDGHCSLAAIGNSGLPDSVGRDVITLGGPYALPAGFILTGGDNVELRQGANLLATGAQTFASGWTTTNCALTTGAAYPAPDGTTTAAKIARTATGAMAIICEFPESNPATWYRFAVWMIAGTLTGTVDLVLEDDTGSYATTVAVTPYATPEGLETTAGVAFETTAGVALETVGGVWQRFEMLAYIPAAAATTLQVVIAPTSAPGAAGDSLYLWSPGVTQVDTETVSLHRVLDGGVADSNGNLTCWVEPEVPSSFTAGAGGGLANVYKPCGKFRIVDLQLPIDAKGRARPGQCTFTAISTLR